MCEKIKNRIPSCMLMLCFSVLICLIALLIVLPQRRRVEFCELVANRDGVISEVRTGLREYSSRITISFFSEKDVSAWLFDYAAEWMDDAMRETDDPREGDYIRYQCGGYSVAYTEEKAENGRFYTVWITPEYYSYLAYEERVTVLVDEIIKSLGFDETTTDYEKTAAVYAYVCENVAYDRIHRRRTHYGMRSTAYAALEKGTATCQGYCVALYRLLREVGVNTRIITGHADGETGGALHAWNIVELDGGYYCLDATWDAGKTEFDWFLKGSADFYGHEPGAEFLDKEFMREYPIRERSYQIPKSDSAKGSVNE